MLFDSVLTNFPNCPIQLVLFILLDLLKSLILLLILLFKCHSPFFIPSDFPYRSVGDPPVSLQGLLPGFERWGSPGSLLGLFLSPYTLFLGVCIRSQDFNSNLKMITNLGFQSGFLIKSRLTVDQHSLLLCSLST